MSSLITKFFWPLPMWPKLNWTKIAFLSNPSPIHCLEKNHETSILPMFVIHSFPVISNANKTQCQLWKRLTGQWRDVSIVVNSGGIYPASAGETYWGKIHTGEIYPGKIYPLQICIPKRMRTTEDQPIKQPGDPSAGLLLTSEKAVFCNMCWKWNWSSAIV